MVGTEITSYRQKLTIACKIPGHCSDRDMAGTRPIFPGLSRSLRDGWQLFRDRCRRLLLHIWGHSPHYGFFGRSENSSVLLYCLHALRDFQNTVKGRDPTQRVTVSASPHCAYRGLVCRGEPPSTDLPERHSPTLGDVYSSARYSAIDSPGFWSLL